MEQPSSWWPGNIFSFPPWLTLSCLLPFKDKFIKYVQTIGRGRIMSCVEDMITCRGFGAKIPVQNPRQVIIASCPQHRTWFLKWLHVYRDLQISWKKIYSSPPPPSRSQTCYENHWLITTCDLCQSATVCLNMEVIISFAQKAKIQDFSRTSAASC